MKKVELFVHFCNKFPHVFPVVFMFSPFFPEGFCLPFAATSPAAYALKLKPPKTPKLQSEEGSYLKTEEFVEVLFQKSGNHSIHA